MITVERVIRSGRSGWDQSVLPRDEYIVRLQALRRAMVQADLDGVVGVGHPADYGDLCYLTGLIPSMGWTAVLVGREADPIVVTIAGSRELSLLQSQTWVGDIRTSASLFADAGAPIAQALPDVVESGATIAITGAENNLSESAYQALRGALDAYRVIERHPIIASLRRQKRPRELLALRAAREIARQAVDHGFAAHAEGASTAAAAVAAERFARLAGAHDVRVLAGGDGESLRPIEDLSADSQETLVLYCAAERYGYWAEASASTAASGESAAIDAMIASAAPGASAGAVAQAGLAALPTGQHPMLLSYGLGGGIGLSLNEGPTLDPQSDEPLLEGEVLTLRTISHGHNGVVAACEPVIIRAGGAEPL